MATVINPETGRRIKIGGATYKKLGLDKKSSKTKKIKIKKKINLEEIAKKINPAIEGKSILSQGFREADKRKREATKKKDSEFTKQDLKDMKKLQNKLCKKDLGVSKSQRQKERQQASAKRKIQAFDKKRKKDAIARAVGPVLKKKATKAKVGVKQLKSQQRISADLKKKSKAKKAQSKKIAIQKRVTGIQSKRKLERTIKKKSKVAKRKVGQLKAGRAISTVVKARQARGAIQRRDKTFADIAKIQTNRAGNLTFAQMTRGI